MTWGKTDKEKIENLRQSLINLEGVCEDKDRRIAELKRELDAACAKERARCIKVVQETDVWIVDCDSRYAPTEEFVEAIKALEASE